MFLLENSTTEVEKMEMIRITTKRNVNYDYFINYIFAVFLLFFFLFFFPNFSRSLIIRRINHFKSLPVHHHDEKVKTKTKAEQERKPIRNFCFPILITFEQITVIFPITEITIQSLSYMLSRKKIIRTSCVEIRFPFQTSSLHD